jgi:hypothetical protein
MKPMNLLRVFIIVWSQLMVFGVVANNLIQTSRLVGFLIGILIFICFFGGVFMILTKYLEIIAKGA